MEKPQYHFNITFRFGIIWKVYGSVISSLRRHDGMVSMDKTWGSLTYATAAALTSFRLA